jgi:hypothetical protein
LLCAGKPGRDNHGHAGIGSLVRRVQARFGKREAGPDCMTFTSFPRAGKTDARRKRKHAKRGKSEVIPIRFSVRSRGLVAKFQWDLHLSIVKGDE